MSMDYAVEKIKEALTLSKGNAARARQQVIAWTYEDARLLHALAKPHLTGIVAYQVERVLSGRAEPVAPRPSKKGAAAKNSLREQEFGQEILKALGGQGGAVFGTEAYSGSGLSPRARKVSQSHVEAIRLMASKSKFKNQ